MKNSYHNEILGILFLCFFLFSSALIATPTKEDKEFAQDEIKTAQKLEKEKNFPSAIAHYKAVLSYVPDYFWAHKQIGMCHYQTGNYDAAIISYEKYLEANPKDTKTRKFVYNMKKQVYSGEFYKKIAPPKTGRELRSSPYLGLGIGALMVAPSDLEGGYLDNEVASDTTLMPWTVEGGWLFSSGFLVQLTMLQGIKRKLSLGTPKNSDGIDYEGLGHTFSQTAMVASVGFVFRAMQNAMFGIHAGAGPSNLKGPNGTKGETLAWLVEARTDYLMGRKYALGLRLGYFNSKFDDFYVNNSGFFARIALQRYLFAMRDLPEEPKKKVRKRK